MKDGIKILFMNITTKMVLHSQRKPAQKALAMLMGSTKESLG
jgi:hypothetical protein